MLQLRLFYLSLLCVLPIFVNTYPQATLDRLMKEYMEGITELKRNARQTKPNEEVEDLTKIEEDVTHEAKEYDFIIIGGGTAGSVIANRLSEVPEWHILLLESGKEENKIGQIPAMAEALQNSKYTWGFKVEPQKHSCLGMENHQCPLQQGKVLGGTSSINSMLYTRGHSLDYDRWSEEDLNSWCYNHVLPYFKKSEDISLYNFDNKYHQKGGPLPVENPPFHSELAKTFLDAGEKLGYQTVDFNGRQQLGFGLTQSMTSHGKRVSSSQAFLAPSIHRKNLDVLVGSHVIEILIGEHSKEVKGVKFLKDGKLRVAKAKREVILSAGLINSPKLLMLSGIGPHKHLDELEIPVKVDLEGVGENLQDHIAFLGLNFLINETDSLHYPPLEENMKLWLTEGKGPLVKTQDVEAKGYIRTKASKDSSDYPDIELQFISHPFDKETGEIFKHSNLLTDETYKSIFEPLHGHYIFSITPLVLHPKSRGSIKLKSKNPLHHPIINGNHFSDPDHHDIETLIEGISTVLELTKTEPFTAWGTKLAEIKVHECDHYEHGSKNYWECFIRKVSVPHGQVGTCKMGPKHDKTAVVDEHLNVYGVKGLRIVDSCVIPNALSGHVTAPTIMVAEKGADIIKESWK